MAVSDLFGHGGNARPGYFSVVRTGTLTSNWQDVDVRATAFAEAADVVALLAIAGLTSADLQARGVLRQINVMNLDDADDAYITEFGTAGTTTVAPADAYATIPAQGPTVTRSYPLGWGFTKAQLRGDGLASWEVFFDVPPEEE